MGSTITIATTTNATATATATTTTINPNVITTSTSTTTSSPTRRYAALTFDPTGRVTQTSVIKAELLGGPSGYGGGGGANVHMRDLLQLGLDVPFHDRHSNRMPPCILPRADCVLVLIGPFKAIVRSDTALFFDTDRAMVRGGESE